VSEHVRAGGSRIHRIIACPRSLQAPDSEAGPAAADGTTAHHIGERCLMTGCDPDHPSFLGQTVLGRPVNRAMADAVAVYVDWARGLIEQCKAAGQEYHLYLEHQVSWASLQPPEAMRGGADLILVIPAMQLMIVGDYKNGTDPVQAAGNKQTRYYAVGALVSLPREITKHVRKVQLTIIQPNAQPLPLEGAVCSETVDVGDLLDFSEEAIQAVWEGQQIDAPTRAGKHCKYCGFAADCEVRAQHGVVEAQNEFEIVTADAPPSVVESMPVEALAEMTIKAEALIERAEAWLKDARARLERELLAGATVPGWKMVAKRATRVWNDEMEVEVWAAKHGLRTDDIYAPRVLKSPAQMEEVVGKKHLPKSLYASVSSGHNLARATSPKDVARLSAGDEFQTVDL